MNHLPRVSAINKKLVWLPVILLIGCISLWLQFTPKQPSTVTQLENTLKDGMRRSVASSVPEERIVIIDIDENSLNLIGPWPWPRSQMAQLLETLMAEHNARMVGLDIVFPAKADPAGDARLHALSQFGLLVVAQLFDLVDREHPLASGVSIASTQQFPGNWPSAKGHLSNHNGLAQARCAGHINSVVDTDGTVRKINPIITWGKSQNLALSLAMLACDPQTAPQLPTLVGAIQGPEWEVPYSKKMTTYTVIPASHILQHQVPPELVRGKWVLIGSSALGLNDTVSTPLANRVPGVMVHAQALTTWLDQLQPMRNRPMTSNGGQLFAAACTVLGLMLMIRVMAYWRAWLLLPVAAILTLAWLAMARAMIPWQQGFSISAPLLAYWAVLLVVPWVWWRTQKESKQLFSTFANYVAPSVLDKMVRQGLDKPLTPQHAHITVLSADMQNYSGLTDRGTLQQTADLTRGFLQCITQPLLKHQGTLDKYTGDGLLAFWGAPLPTEQPANQAMQAALDMVQAVRAWNTTRAAQGLPVARVRIGIESGTALVGDLGTPFRSTYTAVGNCINSASKIQAAAKHYSHDILIGEDAAPHITIVPLHKVADIQWGETVHRKAVFAPHQGPSSCPDSHTERAKA